MPSWPVESQMKLPKFCVVPAVKLTDAPAVPVQPVTTTVEFRSHVAVGIVPPFWLCTYVPPERKASVPVTATAPALLRVPLTLAPPLTVRVPALVMVNVAPLSTVSERMPVAAVLIVGWLVGPEGISTGLVAPGTVAGLQLLAVAQAVLVAPVHVVTAAVIVALPEFTAVVSELVLTLAV
jgi:hypothetical protein